MCCLGCQDAFTPQRVRGAGDILPGVSGIASRSATAWIALALVALAAHEGRAAAADCAAPFTPIPAIQGSGASAARTGDVVTQGVVVGDFEGAAPALRGFYLQDVAGDGDPATSDALFVFGGDADRVATGRVVRVAGSAGEFQGQTQIAAADVVDCEATASAEPVYVALPLASAGALEALEGMLVRLPQTLVVTDTFALGRFGQLTLAPARLAQPTEVAPPGAPALALQAENDRARIVLDDADNAQNADPIVFGRGGAPLSAANTLRAGDRVAGVVGVLGWGWGGSSASPNAWRVRPLGALGGALPVFAASNPRPAAPPDVGGALRVASANLGNFFDSVPPAPCARGAGGAPTACRGASNAAELARQTEKTVALLLGLGADLVAASELENDGYGDPSAIRTLVAALDAASAAGAAGAWAFVDADAGTGVANALGTDAIKVGLLYRPAALAPVGPPAALASGAFGAFTTTSGEIQRNRPALAQTFESVATGERFTAVVVHLKSKGSPCDANVAPVGPDPDAGDGQGACNATRTAAAAELAQWIAADPTGAGDPDVLVVGDFNAYAQEDPIRALREAGLVGLRGAGFEYGYGFAGQWGALDHAFATPSLAAQATGAAEWHVNADEPAVLGYDMEFESAAQQASLHAPDAARASDHDPLVIGLALPEPGGALAGAAAGAALAAQRRRRPRHFACSVSR